jgi:UPF0755 protein
LSSYRSSPPKRRRRFRRLIFVLILLLAAFAVAAMYIRHKYYDNLRPVSDSSRVTMFEIKSGESSHRISLALKADNLIRSSDAFDWYVESHNVRAELQAGVFPLRPSMSTPEIVDAFVKGKIAANLVTILPKQRIDQVRAALVKDGFNADDINTALQAGSYAGSPALADIPTGASLEGFLYPDSFQKDANTKPQTIVKESLDEMAQNLTPDIRAAFAGEGLSVYKGVVLASIVEQEVDTDSDRAQVAQVFLSRLRMGMPLGSDVTAYYGALHAGATSNQNYNSPTALTFDSPYNTLIHKGLPPGPISNVSESSLYAVAHPANTGWLYFVSGDNGKTYFSKTVEEHDQQAAQYCHKLCSAAQ